MSIPITIGLLMISHRREVSMNKVNLCTYYWLIKGFLLSLRTRWFPEFLSPFDSAQYKFNHYLRFLRSNLMQGVILSEAKNLMGLLRSFAPNNDNKTVSLTHGAPWWCSRFSFRSYKEVALGLFLFIFILLALPAYSQEKLPSDDLKYSVTEVRPGDHCIVSGKPLGPNDICLMVEGRRVPLKREALDIFLQNPERYFARLQPKSALFTEDMGQGKPLNLSWFFFGVYVLVGLVFAALTAHTAVAKGLSPIPWFFTGLLINAFGYLSVLTRKPEIVKEVPEGLRKVPLTAEPMKCDKCGHENHPSARTCAACGNSMTPQILSETERVGLK